MFVVMTAVAMAVAFGSALARWHPGRTPIAALWLAMCAPSFCLLSLVMLAFDLGASHGLEALFLISTGALYGLYAILFFLPWRFFLIAVGLHCLSIPLAMFLMMMNC
jgi:hypothetical protein